METDSVTERGREPQVRSTAVSHDEPDIDQPDTDNRVTSMDVYRRRRRAVGVAAAGAIVLGGVVFASTRGGGGTDRLGTVAVTSTTTTTVPATTTTTTTTTTTVPETTTTIPPPTTVPPPTTILVDGVPIWPPYETLPPLDGIAALTGLLADPTLTVRPILAVKIDNHGSGRPQWGLDEADAIFEENVEGVTRFVGLFHSNMPDRVGPVRSARTGDLDLFAAMNRPVLAWSGGNAGVTNWIRSAAASRVLVDFTAQENPCYQRNSSRRAPHNLLLDPECAVATAIEPGPARPLWSTADGWTPPAGLTVTPDTSFEVPMDGVRVGWTWDPAEGLYLRSQNGNRHVAVSGDQIAMNNVVELYTAHPPSPVDARSPNPITVGLGRAVVHRDGVAIEALWARATPYDPFTFADPTTGVPIVLDQGRTFIELTRA
jgi:Protein of unknown function (DUF3048) N-terminal domain/Protein of unknown function (DUF3048) C-terminal domain